MFKFGLRRHQLRYESIQFIDQILINVNQDIYDAVERAVHEADDELQVESPLGSHDEL